MATHPNLISAEELSPLLHTQGLQVIQITTMEVYREGHIPGAVLVLPEDLICGIPPAPGRLPGVDKLNQVFGGIGYAPDTNLSLIHI